MAYTPRNPNTPPKREPAPKPINPFPLIALLVVVVFMILWFGGYV
ncbi:hypothetical protein [Sphingomonas rhizophila]|nr:hypothetical protein [Sphingomonas rhizophila]